jgi:hypothetical protein
MGSAKEELLRLQEESMHEGCGRDCDWCGKEVTNQEFAELPFDGGEPVWIECSACKEERHKEAQAEYDATSAAPWVRLKVSTDLITCNLCTNKNIEHHEGGTKMYEVDSTHPSRAMVVFICEPCLEQLANAYLWGKVHDEGTA